MSKTREWASVNGVLVTADEARISVFDSGFMQGIGLFETMRAYGGVVFCAAAHAQRLITSAKKLGWATTPTEQALLAAIEQVVGACEHSASRVRLTVTTGSLRSAEPSDEPCLTIVATAAAGGGYPDEFYRRGARVTISNYRQQGHDPTVGHKTTSYFARLAALREAHAAGALEALWFTLDGKLAEGSISNVFVVRGEQLLTPTLETPILPGITRAAVLKLSKKLNIAANEQDLSIHDLLDADEVFLTNSMMEILPVIRVEKEDVGNARPGETTMRLLAAYRELVQEECGNADES